MALTFKTEVRKGIIWVRIRGGWFSLIDGKKRYDELQASTGIIKAAKPSQAEKLAMHRLPTILTELEALGASQKRQVTKDEVRARLIEEEVIKTVKRPVSQTSTITHDATVSQVIASYIAERAPKVSDDYLKIYRTLQYYFERYDTHHKLKTTFTKFDAAAFKSFWKWQDEVYRGKIKLPPQGKGRNRTNSNGFSPDSIRKYQKAFYAILDYAAHHNIALALKNTRYERSLLITDAAKAPNRKYLTPQEIQLIIDFVPTSQAEAIARQYLIVGCLTGQRFQTMRQLHEAKIKQSEGFKYVDLTYQKTKREGVVIPLFPAIADEKFYRYNSNVVINRDIKDVCRKVGISEADEVTTHTVKRSFYSNLAAADVPAHIIQLITHPKAIQTAMQGVYDNRQSITRARLFFDEVRRSKTEPPYIF